MQTAIAALTQKCDVRLYYVCINTSITTSVIDLIPNLTKQFSENTRKKKSPSEENTCLVAEQIGFW